MGVEYLKFTYLIDVIKTFSVSNMKDYLKNEIIKKHKAVKPF